MEKQFPAWAAALIGVVLTVLGFIGWKAPVQKTICQDYSNVAK